jgi:hypothetical protein
MLVWASFVLAGCTAATVPEYPPLDDAIAHVQLADPLAAIAEAQLGVPIAPLKLPGRTRCPFVGATGRFECDPHVAGTLTYRRAYQLLGENGAPVDRWDAAVAAIRFFSDITGQITTRDGVLDISRQDDAMLGDLRELRQTLTGSATLTWTDGVSSWSSRRRSELLVMSRARMPGTFPVGTIELSANRVDPSLRRSANMTFDGSPVALMLVSFDGQASVQCAIPLQSGGDPGDCD